MLTPDNIQILNGVTVKEYLLTNHNPNKIPMPSERKLPPQGITIHNTNLINVRGTTMSEQYTRATANGNTGSVRVHYYIDDKEAWQNLPLSYQSWHAADGSGPGNSTTIALECIMGGESGFEKSEDNCARLTAYLLNKYSLSTDKLYTHTYWLNIRDKVKSDKDLCTLSHPYKTCPYYIIPHWNEFKSKVQGYLNELQKPIYCIQIGAFTNKDYAEKFLNEVKKSYPGAFIVKKREHP